METTMIFSFGERSNEYILCCVFIFAAHDLYLSLHRVVVYRVWIYSVLIRLKNINLYVGIVGVSFFSLSFSAISSQNMRILFCIELFSALYQFNLDQFDLDQVFLSLYLKYITQYQWYTFEFYSKFIMQLLIDYNLISEW